jgi:hypothetical protein
MDGITFDKPVPFQLPEYDYSPVRAVARATDLTNFYNNILSDGFERSDDDFMYGIPPNVIKRLHEAAKSFDWKPWAEKIKGMGEHYKVNPSKKLQEVVIDRLNESSL